MSTQQTRDDLAWYLDRPAGSIDDDTVADAEEWQTRNPGSSLAEWVDAMVQIGAL